MSIPPLITKDYGANTSTISYILDEFAYFFETPFGEFVSEGAWEGAECGVGGFCGDGEGYGSAGRA